jgi:S-disulfanyl-L-cysteine oxidoreductase SoxD
MIIRRFAAVVAICAAPGMVYAQGAPTLWSNGIIPTRSVWSGVYTEAQAARGERIYRRQCAECHLDFLEGDPSEGPPELAGPHFMVNWDGLSVADLAHHMHTQPNDDPSDMDATTAADLVAFILQFNKVPAGTTELPTDRSIQAQIGITPQPPAR